MQTSIEEFPEMMQRLSEGGFDDDQSRALVEFVGRLYSGQNQVIDDFRREVNERFDKLESKFESKLDTRFNQLSARIDRTWIMMLGMLAAMLVTMAGTWGAVAFQILRS